MQQSAVRRSFYGTSQGRTKHATLVLPILDNARDPAERSDCNTTSDPASARGENNWRTGARASRVPQNGGGNGDDEEDEVMKIGAAGIVLQKKSAQYEIPQHAVRFASGGIALGSNQDMAENNNAARKYTVFGQKQQWRRNRSSQRARGLTQTIAPVVDTVVVNVHSDENETSELRCDNDNDNEHNDDDVDLENPRFSVRESFGSSHDSERSSRFESERSIGRGSSFSNNSSGGHASVGPTADGEDKQRFVVTRQKKFKFAARVYLPGQKPLYLGRYTSEAAAIAACESALSVVTTPRK